MQASIPSSISRNHPLVKDAMMAKMMSDLLKIHKQFLDKMEELSSHAQTIKNLPAGEKGDMPEVDYNHVIQAVLSQIPEALTRKYVTPESVVADVLKQIPTPQDGKSVDEAAVVRRIVGTIRLPEDGKPGKNAVIDHEALSDLVVQKIVGGKKLKVEHIAGLRGEVDSYRAQLAGKQYGKDTWARGGGDTVVAGSNVTFGKDANGNKIINATGSASYLTPTGLVNASNTVYGVTARPSSVIADGILYFEGHGYSYALFHITFDVPPSQYVRYTL